MEFRRQASQGNRSPLDRFVEWFDDVLATRGLPATDELEEKALRKIFSDLAEQTVSEAYARSARR
jgi:hypothetical protein